MFDDDTIDGDEKILAKFREWRSWNRRCQVDLPGDSDDDPERLACYEAIDRLEDEINDAHAVGTSGLAIKIFLEAYSEYGGVLSAGPDVLIPRSDFMRRITRSALSDAVRFVPELMPLCAPALAEEAVAADEGISTTDALRQKNHTITGAVQQDLGAPSAASLSELFAAEERASLAHSAVEEKADLLYFAWRKAHPDMPAMSDEEKWEDLPEPMGGLYRQATAVNVVLFNLIDRIGSWVPATTADAAALLDWLAKDVPAEEKFANLLAGLRAIAAREGPPSAEPEILTVFREWLREYILPVGDKDRSDEQIDAAADDLVEIEHRMFDMPAGDVRGLAVKAFMTAFYSHEGKGPALAAFDPDFHYGSAGKPPTADTSFVVMIMSRMNTGPQKL